MVPLAIAAREESGSNYFRHASQKIGRPECVSVLPSKPYEQEKFLCRECPHESVHHGGKEEMTDNLVLLTNSPYAGFGRDVS